MNMTPKLYEEAMYLSCRRFKGWARRVAEVSARCRDGSGVLLMFLLAGPILAASVNGTVDGGGNLAASHDYVMNGSLGEIGGISMNDVSTNILRHGFVGQLSEVVSMVITSTPPMVDEGASIQLSGVVELDDGTVSRAAGSDINWSSPVFPISSISPGGLATTTIVYEDTGVVLVGRHRDVVGTGTVLVMDANPDNYQAYTGDRLPDWWQVRYFGPPPNPSASPTADPGQTGQNNLFKYVAGLDPTNQASVFVIRIRESAGLSNHKEILFFPRWQSRIYEVEYTTNLTSQVYQHLSGTTTSDNGTERVVIDLDATETTKFYRIKISVPP